MHTRVAACGNVHRSVQVQHAETTCGRSMHAAGTQTDSTPSYSFTGVQVKPSGCAEVHSPLGALRPE